jgi:hypothetical protein
MWWDSISKQNKTRQNKQTKPPNQEQKRKKRMLIPGERTCAPMRERERGRERQTETETEPERSNHPSHKGKRKAFMLIDGDDSSQWLCMSKCMNQEFMLPVTRCKSSGKKAPSQHR